MGRLMIAVAALLAILSATAGTAFAQEPTPTPTPAATATPTPTATPGRLRNFGLEGYFEPLPIAPPDPSAQALFSPMDLRLIARSAILCRGLRRGGDGHHRADPGHLLPGGPVMTAMDLLFGAVFIALFIGSLIYLDWLFERLRHGEDLPDR